MTKKTESKTEDTGITDAEKAAIKAAIDADATPQVLDDEVDEEDLVTLEQVTLRITRDNTKTITKAFRHEVDVYVIIHGEENVEEIDSEDVSVADFDPTSELDRLTRKFGKNGEAAVDTVFGHNPERLAKLAGVQVDRSKKRSRNADQAMIVDHANPGESNSGRVKTARVVKMPRKSAKSSKK